MTLFSILLGLHVTVGFTALVVAPAAMMARKGGTWHSRWGNLYFGSMVAVAVTAIAMALMRSGVFLLLVGIFSFYLSFSGRRALLRKRPTDRAAALDWVVTLVALAGSIALVVYGVLRLGQGESFGWVAVSFGFLGAAFSGLDLHRFMRPPTDRRAWWFAHMNGMLGSYVATVTAFSAVNLAFLPPVARWLWPAVVGSVGISLWARAWRRRFARGRMAEQQHEVMPA